MHAGARVMQQNNNLIDKNLSRKEVSVLLAQEKMSSRLKASIKNIKNALAMINSKSQAEDSAWETSDAKESFD